MNVVFCALAGVVSRVGLATQAHRKNGGLATLIFPKDGIFLSKHRVSCVFLLYVKHIFGGDMVCAIEMDGVRLYAYKGIGYGWGENNLFAAPATPVIFGNEGDAIAFVATREQFCRGAKIVVLSQGGDSPF